MTPDTKTLIGQSASYRVTPNPKSQDWIDFAVVIVAIRSNFGRTDLRIKPAQGTGETWVSSESICFNPMRPENLNQKNTKPTQTI